MLTADRYYKGEHDILKELRTAIGEDGKEIVVDNLPNNHLVDNQYGIVVDQKTNYSCGKPVVFQSKNDRYNELLREIFDDDWNLIFTQVAHDAVNCGIAWIHPYYENGMLRFRRLPPAEVCPVWLDTEHRKLQAAIRVYSVIEVSDSGEQTVQVLEVYTADGVQTYKRKGTTYVLQSTDPYQRIYVVENGQELEVGARNWERIPLVAFRSNLHEQPLINRVKSLQDNINRMLSDFANAMQEDAGRSILVLKGYGEEKPSAARAAIMQARIINVDSDGDLKSLATTVEAANYQAILKESRDQLIKVARGYDAKDDRIGSNANRANIASMYNDIDLDANTLERNFKASLKELKWFVDTYLLDTGKGSYYDVPLQIIFNRDTIVNTTEAIDGIIKAYQAGVISLKTAIKLYPDIDDVDEELLQHDEEAAVPAFTTGEDDE